MKLYVTWTRSLFALFLTWVAVPVVWAADGRPEATDVAVSATASSSLAPLADVGAKAVERPLWRKIDDVVSEYHRGPKAARTDDATFLRRVYLDLIGRSPTAAELRAFLDTAEQAEGHSNANDFTATHLGRREKIIDSLLASPEFAVHFATVFDVMIMERRPEKHVPLSEWREFLRQWFADNRPLDELCREILAADGTGDSLRPAAKFYLDREVEANLITRDVGRVFFGRNVQCAQCHDHPIVGDYRQAEYFGILAFLNRSFLFQDAQQGNKAFLAEKASGKLEFTSVFLPENGSSAAQTILPDAMAMDVEPKFKEDAEAYLVAPTKEVRSVPKFSLRQQLAVMATHPKSEAFNRNLANRIWAYMLGVGVVHPVDLHHSDNPPISADLLHLLADHCVAIRYDLRGLLKQIALSETYQRSVSLPHYEQWDGPAFDPDVIRTEVANFTQKLERLAEDEKSLGVEIEQAQLGVAAAQADVAAVQKEIDAAEAKNKEFLASAGSPQVKQKPYDDLVAKQKSQQETLKVLEAAAQQAEKAVKQLPADKELAASHALIAQRAAALVETLKQLETEVQQANDVLAAAKSQADALSSRVAGLESRRLVFSEFVTEARGIQRVLHVRQQRFSDQRGDWDRQRRLAEKRLAFVDLRQKLQKTDSSAAASEADELRRDLGYAAESLQQEWVREFAARPVRGLSPEQLANAVFSALEFEERFRLAAFNEWEANHKDNPQMLADTAARDAHVLAAIAGARASFHGEFVDRFSSPAGSPQDLFYAAADQALFMLNDGTVQEWLQPTEGSLVHRLQSITDTDELTTSIYWSVLSRSPDDEERAAIREY
ncbi:MAG: DUF1549 domain-containing protein, partial [Planctomycetota bacterium]|nr:DUF1549 domain-containing protein [Planctomycetota bacterium]